MESDSEKEKYIHQMIVNGQFKVFQLLSYRERFLKKVPRIPDDFNPPVYRGRIIEIFMGQVRAGEKTLNFLPWLVHLYVPGVELNVIESSRHHKGERETGSFHLRVTTHSLRRVIEVINRRVIFDLNDMWYAADDRGIDFINWYINVIRGDRYLSTLFSVNRLPISPLVIEESFKRRNYAINHAESA